MARPSANGTSWTGGLIAAAVFVGIQLVRSERFTLADGMIALVVGISVAIAIRLYERSQRTPPDRRE